MASQLGGSLFISGKSFYVEGEFLHLRSVVFLRHRDTLVRRNNTSLDNVLLNVIQTNESL